MPGGIHDLRKSLSDRRTGNLKYHRHIFGDNCEELTCRWRGVKNLNKENDNYRSPIDHSRDQELGIIQTKGRLYDSIERRWHSDWSGEHDKEFDNLIYYCASKDGKYIERIYIFPMEEVIKRITVVIVKNPSKGVQWYDLYRIKDEKVIVKINEIWKEICQECKIPPE